MNNDNQFTMLLIDDSPTLEQNLRCAKAFFKNRNGKPKILGSINPVKDHWMKKFVDEYLKDKDNERL